MARLNEVVDVVEGVVKSLTDQAVQLAKQEVRLTYHQQDISALFDRTTALNNKVNVLETVNAKAEGNKEKIEEHTKKIDDIDRKIISLENINSERKGEKVERSQYKEIGKLIFVSLISSIFGGVVAMVVK